ncbi:hypothetical protein ABID16_003403 [Rhizobium aquaticum]|uniref:Polysaccharide chain length determinant N-terminal domain-containing protein n=1 Tax=Rhizobium aquaticum TaxID=1549636 RepID=A0ABV2J2R7_9HYPH
MSRQMTDGIDLLEFLAEIWRVRLRFVGIIVITTAVFAGAIQLGKRGELGSTNAGPSALRGWVVRLDPVISSHPYLMDRDAVLRDFSLRIRSFDKAGFDNLAEVSQDVTKSVKSYAISPSGGTFFAYINTVGEGSQDAEGFRNALVAASSAQFGDVVQQVNGDVALIQKMGLEAPARSSDALALQEFKLRQFLSLPAVRDGTLRFVDVGPLRPVKERPVNSPSLSQAAMTKILIIGALSGFILACFYVVARIALSRASKIQD